MEILALIYTYYMKFAMPIFFVAWIIKVVAEFTNFKTVEKIGKTVMWITVPVFLLKIFEMLDNMLNAY